MENSLPEERPHYAELEEIRSSLTTKRRPSKLWIILGVVAVVLLVIVAVFQALTPDTVTVPRSSFVQTNANNTLPGLVNVAYTGPAVELPAQFSIFSSQQTITRQQVIADLLARYGLIKPSNDANYWENGGITLYEDTTLKTLTLTLKDLADEELPVVDPSTAQGVAALYLQQTFPEITLRPMMEQASFYTLSIEPDSSVEPSEATAINIPFTPVLETETYPVIFQKALFPAFTVTVDGRNTIRSVTFFPDFNQYVKIDTKVPITIDEALAQIKSGTASIIDATIEDINRVPLSDLTSADFKTVVIEYREDPSTKLLYPFYHFTGTATSESGVTADVDVITPAVRTTATR